MAIAIISALVTILGSVVIFYVGRFYEKRDKSRRLIIETSITSTELVNPDKLGPISVLVDQGFITKKRVDSGKLIPVKSAYNYVISVSNIGLDTLENPEIDITLGDEARIVEMKVKSDVISEDKIEFQ